MTITIEVIRDGVFHLLSEMEQLGLIKVEDPKKNHQMLGVKLSEQFAGALHLSDKTYDAYQNALQESRNKWARDIY